MIDEAQARSILEAALALLSKGRIEEGKALLQGSLNSNGKIHFIDGRSGEIVDVEAGPESPLRKEILNASFVIGGKGGSTVFEIGRQNSVIGVRTITSHKSPGVPGT